MDQFTSEQRRQLRAIAYEVVRELEASKASHRGGRQATTVSATQTASWLPMGQLLATEDDVMRALQIGETKLDEMVAAGLLKPVFIDSCRRFDPGEIEQLRERLRRERVVRTVKR